MNLFSLHKIPFLKINLLLVTYRYYVIISELKNTKKNKESDEISNSLFNYGFLNIQPSRVQIYSIPSIS
nr:MAG TPA: hypothetical protein [Caudoviricetes sp.]